MAFQLTLVIHSLNGGGAERTLATMANHWANEGIQVTVVTLDSPNNDIYELSATVRRVDLAGMRHSASVFSAVANNIRRLYRLRRAVSEAAGDAVISFTDKMNVLTLLACIGLRQRVIICERVDPRRHEIGCVWSLLRRLTYAWCDTLVVQTYSVKEFFCRFVANSKIQVIANAIQEREEALEQNSARNPWIVALGRLERQKGFDLLIEAFSRISGKHPGWQLKILGDGSLRQSLADQVQTLGLEQSVELCGWVESPQSWLRQSELFVLSSRYEGFPNALLEAMSAGIPAISFDCESGPSEIIRHEVDGLLVPANDVNRLSEAIDRLLSSSKERGALGQRAMEVRERFSPDRYYQQWDFILKPDSVDPPASEREN